MLTCWGSMLDVVVSHGKNVKRSEANHGEHINESFVAITSRGHFINGSYVGYTQAGFTLWPSPRIYVRYYTLFHRKRGLHFPNTSFHGAISVKSLPVLPTKYLIKTTCSNDWIVGYSRV